MGNPPWTATKGVKSAVKALEMLRAARPKGKSVRSGRATEMAASSLTFGQVLDAG